MDRKIPLIYDTLSECINDPNIVGGMVVKTLGENTINDGNGRIYKVYDPSMGVVYDRNKHILLAKSGTFMGSVDDTPLYEDVKQAKDDIDYLKNQSSIADLTHVERCYNNEAELKEDSKLSAGMIVKTFGKLNPGDGLGKTYIVVPHDSSVPYGPDEIQLENWDIAAKLIDASYAEAIAVESKDDIDAIKADLHENILGVFDVLETFKESPYPKNGMSVRLLGKDYVGDGVTSLYKVYEESAPYGATDVELAKEYNTFNDLDNASDVVDGMRVRTKGRTSVGDGEGALYKLYDAEYVNGYLFNNMFYVDEGHEVPLKIADNIVYTDLSAGGGTKRYVWNGEIFEILESELILSESGLHARVMSKGLYAMLVKETSEGSSIAELEGRVDNLEDGLTATNQRLGIAEDKVRDINTNIGTMNTDIENIEDDLNEVTNGLSQTVGNLNTVSTRVGQVETNFNNYTISNNSRVSQLETNLSTTNNKLDQTRTSLNTTNNTLNSLRTYTYNNVNDLLYQINEPSISDWKTFSYYQVEKAPSGSILSREFVISIESGSNGMKHIIVSGYSYSIYCYIYNDKPYSDADHTQLLEIVSGRTYIDIPTNKAYMFEDGFIIEIENPDLHGSGGDEEDPDIPSEDQLFKEVRGEISAEVTVDGPNVTVDVLADSASWIAPIFVKHFEADPEPEPLPTVDAYFNSEDGIFYSNYSGGTFSDPIEPEEDIIYVDLLDSYAEYIWNGDGYVGYDPYADSVHFFDEGTNVMLNSDSEYPVTMTLTHVTEQYEDDEGQIVTVEVPHYIFKAKRAPETRVVYYV